MVKRRPVDNLEVPDTFRFTRIEALVLGCCAKCGQDVNPAGMDHLDAMEYGISALCPECYGLAVGDDDCE